MGSFWTPDPGGIRAANPSNPSSWNRYAYANGDPINLNDPKGLYTHTIEGCDSYFDGGCVDDIVPEGMKCDQWINDAFLSEAGPVGCASFVPVQPDEKDSGPDCDALTAAVGFAGLDNGEATEIWNDFGTTNGANSVGVAALGVVTWAGESSFKRFPVNNGNSNESVDIGPMQLNYQVWKSGIPANQQGAVFGTNLQAGQTFDSNTDANIIAGLRYLNSLYNKFGDQAAGLYTGRKNPNRAKRNLLSIPTARNSKRSLAMKNCIPKSSR